MENEIKFQTDFLLENKGDLEMNHLGRFEELDQGFKYLCNYLNLQATLPKNNISLTKDYRN